MNKTLLKDKLKSYSALATAVFGTAAVAEAQTGYTDVNPDATLTTINDSLTSQDIDFDGDGNPEMIIGQYGFVLPNAGQINLSLTLFQPNDVAALLGYDDDGYPYIQALASGVLVDPAATNWYDTTAFGGSQASNSVGLPQFSVTYGQFNTGSDLYVGARFLLGSGTPTTHYGWVRLQVNATSTTTIVKDYAYRINPNTGLVTGQTGVGINEMPSNVWFVALNGKNIVVSAKEEGNVTVVDATGRKVATGTVVNGIAEINLGEDAAAGIYVVNFENNGVMGSKKVILN
jgi:hypothetical protein